MTEMERKRCCATLRFQGVPAAQAYCLYSIGRGAIYMSAVTLTSAFVFLASQDAGCTTTSTNGAITIVEDCEKKTHGMAPAALIANISVIAGLLNAFGMPYIGAMIDCTPNRRAIGIVLTVLLGLTQFAHIGLHRHTWFFLAIVQGVAGALFECVTLVTFSYLPEIGRLVGENSVTHFIKTCFAVQYIWQIIFLFAAMSLGVGFSWHDTASSVSLARATQVILAVAFTISCTMAWTKFPSVPAQRVLPEQSRLWISGLQQVVSTSRALYRDHRRTLFMFMLAVATSEAFAYSITTLSVVFLGNVLGLTSTEVIIFFVVAMLGGFVGPFLGTFVAAKYGLKNSWSLSIIGMLLSCAVGGITIPRRALLLVILWGVVLGMFQSWHYTMERAMFCMILPKGQDSEFSGFFIYCHIILSWLPPLIYAALVQSKLNQRYALVSLSLFGMMAIVALSLLQIDGQGDKPQSSEPRVDATPDLITSSPKEEEDESEDYV